MSSCSTLLIISNRLIADHTILIGSSNFLWFARAELGEVKTDAHQQTVKLDQLRQPAVRVRVR